MSAKTYLFEEFSPISAKEWKQQIQMELKGADYNKTLVWESLEGIRVKPFYHIDEYEYLDIPTSKLDFKIAQEIFIDNPEIANKIALDALAKGATAIQFTALQSFDLDVLFQNFDSLKKKPILYFKNQFLSPQFNTELLQYFKDIRVVIQQDIIGQLAQTGNWFRDKKSDFEALKTLFQKNPSKICIGIDASIYQNAGATNIQQIAYALAHASEYLNAFGKECATAIQFEFAVGSNYFFEIAKLRAFRYLWQELTREHQNECPAKIIVKPTNRTKTIYDYNVNMLRTSTEYMSAVLGGADTIITQAYDHLFKKSNNFSQRIARNQLLLLKEENGFIDAQNFAKGSYYIESLTVEMAKKALVLLKEIEKSGGFLKQLKTGTIQNKIKESAQKEQSLFDQEKLILLGTNKYPNTADVMKGSMDLYPFVKKNTKQTKIQPILTKRLSEKLDKERLDKE